MQGSSSAKVLVELVVCFGMASTAQAGSAGCPVRIITSCSP
jgi:hypothetical protein